MVRPAYALHLYIHMRVHNQDFKHQVAILH